MAIFRLQQQSWAVVTETICPAKTKIFPAWPFIELVFTEIMDLGNEHPWLPKRETSRNYMPRDGSTHSTSSYTRVSRSVSAAKCRGQGNMVRCKLTVQSTKSRMWEALQDKWSDFYNFKGEKKGQRGNLWIKKKKKNSTEVTHGSNAMCKPYLEPN